MAHAVHPAGAAARTMAVGRGLRHLRMALGMMGNFTRCGGRVFRPLRRATGAFAPGPQNVFEKKFSKSFFIWVLLDFLGFHHYHGIMIKMGRCIP